MYRVEDWSDVGRGFLVGDQLVASDGYYEWYGQSYLNGGKRDLPLVPRKPEEMQGETSRCRWSRTSAYQSLEVGEHVDDVRYGVHKEDRLV